MCDDHIAGMGPSTSIQDKNERREIAAVALVILMPYWDGGFSSDGGIECDPGSGQSISHTRTERRNVSQEEDLFGLSILCIFQGAGRGVTL